MHLVQGWYNTRLSDGLTIHLLLRLMTLKGNLIMTLTYVVLVLNRNICITGQVLAWNEGHTISFKKKERGYPAGQ